MDLLILYSQRRKGELLSLATLLHQKGGIGFRPVVLPDQWSLGDSEDLHHFLKDATHWLYLVDEADLSNPAFLFAAGHSLAVHERCYLLDPGRGSIPGYWRNLIHICADFSSLVAALESERDRWVLFLARLEAKGKLVERGLETTNSAFLEAVAQGDAVSCELFLKAGFSPDLTDKKGVSVLCLAVRGAHLGVAKLLLDGGANVNLRSRDRDNSPVMDAAADGRGEMVSELLQRGADLSGLSRNGQNCLVLAIGKGAQDVALQLLGAGADPFVPDKLGMNAYQYAQMMGRKEFAAEVATRFPDKV